VGSRVPTAIGDAGTDNIALVLQDSACPSSPRRQNRRKPTRTPITVTMGALSA
jgi:hypothetical protein